MIRVLVVDDSPTARELLAAIFEADPDLAVVGMAADGDEAVEMTEALRPDVISMDAQMPRMGGLEATRVIMSRVPTPIVIVSASFVAGEVSDAMQALRAGALAVIGKPRGPGAPDFDAMSREVCETVKNMSQVKVIRHWATDSPVPPPRLAARRAGTRPQLIAIAASTGGPAVLSEILRELPVAFPLPILVVQHIAIGFAAGFATWLDSVVPLEVKVPRNGEGLRAGTVYVAPDDAHMGLADRRTVRVEPGPPIAGFRPSATYLFESAARMYGAEALGIILTGMGTDGVDGLQELSRRGGEVIAQDETSSVVYGMPGAAVAAGVTTSVLPTSAIAALLRDQFSHPA
ncbi:MAG TPA: chemotaxis-specific protein-glutamate methyltransferase CheB [Kofleriaceae bacterium]|nr:chemotaxis-specific protein-glutamate methyltransferase CheB [Kofleriaceae bacterium]